MSISIVFCHKHSLDRTVDYLVSFDQGRLEQRYPSPFATYQRLREEAQQLEAPAPPNKAAADEPEPRRRSARKLSYKEQRELEAAEARIAALEDRQAELQRQINASGSDYTRLQTLATELQQVETELDLVLARWLELSDLSQG